MLQSELLKNVVKKLSEAGIEYMLTGSLVSSMQGEPRATHDIDVVISLKKADVEKFINLFSSENFYIDRESIIRAVEHKRMFNIIEITEGLKIDFWILKNDEFDQTRFSRKYLEDFEGEKIWISSPEDTILMKLYWAKISGGSEKHFTDALRVYEIQSKKLNMKYLEDWAEKLNIKDLLNKLKEKAETVE